MRRTIFLFLAIALTAGCACAKPLGKKPVVEKRSEFQRGVGLGLFANDPDWDYSGLLDEIVAHGATDVLVVVAWYQADVAAHEIAPRPTYSPSDAAIERTLKQAKARGLRVTMLPIVRLIYRAPNQWRGKIDPAAGVPEWFKSYRRYLLRMARHAQAAGVERFSVGSELLSLEKEREEWVSLIGDVREVYSGRLLYSANWDHFDPVTFWDQLDDVGVTAYFELVRDGEQPSLELMTSRWATPIAQLRGLADRLNKPVLITEIGYPSKTTAARYPWDETRDAPIDLKQQADAYRAFCEAWRRESPILDGFYFWNWFGFGGDKDGDYTPRGKPAARELERCFQSDWKTRKGA